MVCVRWVARTSRSPARQACIWVPTNHSHSDCFDLASGRWWSLKICAGGNVTQYHHVDESLQVAEPRSTRTCCSRTTSLAAAHSRVVTDAPVRILPVTSLRSVSRVLAGVRAPLTRCPRARSAPQVGQRILLGVFAPDADPQTAKMTWSSQVLEAEDVPEGLTDIALNPLAAPPRFFEEIYDQARPHEGSGVA